MQGPRRSLPRGGERPNPGATPCLAPLSPRRREHRVGKRPTRCATCCSALSADRGWSKRWPSRRRAPSAEGSELRSLAVCSEASRAADEPGQFLGCRGSSAADGGEGSMTDQTVDRPSRFVSYAWMVVVVNLAVVLWGALVRATGSGAGCGGHWPLCNGEILPAMASQATQIEFIHRVISGIALVLVVGLWIW